MANQNKVFKILNDIKEKVWQVYEPYLPKNSKFSQLIRDYPERKGKYVRAALIYLSCEFLGGDPNKTLLTAAAYQAGEDWILIHDDVYDESEERRGKSCLHKIYGEKQAINAGDALHMIMWKMLRDNRDVLGEKLSRKIEDKIFETLITTAEGQYFELNWIAENNINLSEKDYFYKVDIISGLYTIITPLQLGAMIAGADTATLHKIEQFARPLGRAFQIRDDVLNLAHTEEYGKEKYGDIWEGKRTLMLVHLLKNCTPKEEDIITKIYAKKRTDKTDDEINYVVELMQEYSSIDYAQKIAEDYSKEALELFDRNFAHIQNEAKEKLHELIYFMATRNV